VTDTFRFDAPLWLWDARKADSWFFVTLPEDVSDEIGVRFGVNAAGFGSIKVEVTIGATTWQTSVFPDAIRGYVLPIKKQVRRSEGLGDGTVAQVRLRVTAPR